MTEAYTDDYDNPWKNVLETYFEDFLRFFFPEVHAGIDWTHGYTFLDKELQQVVRDAKFGERRADKLVRVWLKEGGETWILIHIEIQSQEETGFSLRMYVYHYRIFDRYGQQVVSLAVLADDRASWQPNQFGYERWGCALNFRFPIVKLTNYHSRWDELEASDNPFATVVMAHLKTQETQHNPEERAASKRILIRRLFAKGYSRQDILNLFHFIDWLMRLPAEMEDQLWNELQQQEEAKKMPYISSVERIGMRKGRQATLQESIERIIRLKFALPATDLMPDLFELTDQTRLQDLMDAAIIATTVHDLRQRIAQVGILPAREPTPEERLRRSLLSGIELALELKFGPAGLALLPDIRQLTDAALLETILASIKAANTPEDVRLVYQH